MKRLGAVGLAIGIALFFTERGASRSAGLRGGGQRRFQAD
jgi:hypothetical protein